MSGFALPHPDTSDQVSLVTGAKKRFLFCPPCPKQNTLRDLTKFVDEFLKKNLVPLSPDSDTSVEHWLKNTRYTESRKAELLKVYRSTLLRKKHYRVKSFMKDENYDEYKYPRCINSRHDRFKCEVGPIFKLIEEQVYKLHWFIKHVPVADRPDYIMKLIGATGNVFVATDYTAFESLFTKEIMKSVEMQLYEYMTRNLKGGRKWYRLVKHVMTGKQSISFKNFHVEVEATRMSGEMCTSLGNGFSNLMFMLFACHQLGSSCDGVVEGDDGLFAIHGQVPTTQDFENMGLKIKLETHKTIETASFCGIVFDPTDRANVTDPRSVLGSFGWTTHAYDKAGLAKRKLLLRAKSMSYLYQYPGSPIIQALARYGLRVTSDVDDKSLRRYVNKLGKNVVDQWTREQFLDAMESELPIKQVGHRTRLLVQSCYGIPVNVQLAIENYLDSLDILKPLVIPFASLFFPKSYAHYYHNYIADETEFPIDRWPKLPSERDKVLTVTGFSSFFWRKAL